MEVHPASKSLILKLRDPSRVTSLIPRARVVPIDGINYTQVKFGLDEARVLRNMGVKNVPSPIQGRYDWPGRYKPMDHQRDTASFLTFNRRAFVRRAIGRVNGHKITGRRSNRLPVSGNDRH